MKRNTRKRWIGTLSLALIAVAAIVVVLTVFAGTDDDRFTATAYSDVIRFEARGVASLHVRVYDLSGKEVWDSGVMSGDSVDWDRRNEFGERLAYGAYLYSAQGWSASGDSIFQKNGKLALMPGDKVQLQLAPVTSSTSMPAPEEKPPYAPMAYSYGNLSISGNLGVGVDPAAYKVDIFRNIDGLTRLQILNASTGGNALVDFIVSSGAGKAFAVQKFGPGFNQFTWSGMSLANWARFRSDTSVAGLIFTTGGASPLVFGTSDAERMRISGSGNVGIGATNPAAKLEIESSTGQDLIAAYNSSNRVFVVKSTGEVRADGTVYAADFQTGSADVAERINVSEWVEAGYVVEIDPEHPGFFRKSSSSYSTKVAGIISTSPGVVLGNDFDATKDDWEDNRPVLAIAGRVPCKASTENGPIQIGDLLVSSSTPGIAMKGDSDKAIGVVVGKAMEPLENGEGTIMVQVMLR
jgi:hypothetical protein